MIPSDCLDSLDQVEDFLKLQSELGYMRCGGRHELVVWPMIKPADGGAGYDLRLKNRLDHAVRRVHSRVLEDSFLTVLLLNDEGTVFKIVYNPDFSRMDDYFYQSLPYEY